MDNCIQRSTQIVRLNARIFFPFFCSDALLGTPAEHNIKLSKRALSMGMNLTHSGLTKDGKIIASTEKEVFEALGLSYIERAHGRVQNTTCI